MSVSVRAQTDWSGPPFGSWFTPSHWTAGVPANGDTASINSGLAAIESNASEAEVTQLIVGGTNSGALAGLGIGSNTIHATMGTIGRDAGSNGLITVGTNGLVDISSGTLADTLTVGKNGSGTMLVSSGGHVDITVVRTVVGEFAGASGSITVQGGIFETNSFLSNRFAPAGSASITVTNGGQFSTRSAAGDDVGENGGIATFSVSGTNSLLEMANTTVSSASTFTASDGGTMSFVTLAALAGSFNVEAGGYLEVTDELYLFDAASITLELGGMADAQRGHLSAYRTYLDGELVVSLVDGFQPVLGNSFSIFSWIGPRTGTFDTLDLPDLAPGLAWDASSFYSNGMITVVPEPDAVHLLLPVLAASWLLRRRRGAPGEMPTKHTKHTKIGIP